MLLVFISQEAHFSAYEAVTTLGRVRGLEGRDCFPFMTVSPLKVRAMPWCPQAHCGSQHVCLTTICGASSDARRNWEQTLRWAGMVARGFLEKGMPEISPEGWWANSQTDGGLGAEPVSHVIADRSAWKHRVCKGSLKIRSWACPMALDQTSYPFTEVVGSPHPHCPLPRSCQGSASLPEGPAFQPV